MKVFESFEDFREGGLVCRDSRPIVTVGSFDGLHVGHQELIAKMREWASDEGCEHLVLTFHKHPRTFMTGQAIKRITPAAHKLELLARYGVENTLLVHFDEDLQATSAYDFCRRYLVDLFAARGLLLGHNNRIGRGREGTPESLREYGHELGFETRVVKAVDAGGESVSSSVIRQAIEAGDFARASEMLGRPYAIHGQVTKGDQRGRTIGFATANLALEGVVHPSLGVYAVRVKLDGQEYAGAANIGLRPTVDPERTEPLLEVHLLEFDGDIYGRDILVEFCAHVRPEQRFSGLDALQQQIERDREWVREYFASTHVEKSSIG